ncbi:hypothetical protein [Thermincola ferriacetica]
MHKPKNDEGFLKNTLCSLIWNTEISRWAIYEIKSNSEKGKILKEIIYWFCNNSVSELTFTPENTSWITTRLIELGFDKNSVEQVILLLACKALEN